MMATSNGTKMRPRKSENSEKASNKVPDALAEKARQLFAVCDLEEKGFVTCTDMHRLVGELPLTEKQLEEVFTTLDDDHNGQLTLEEFSDGFGMYLGISANHSPLKRVKRLPLSNGRALSPIREFYSDPFEDFLDKLGCRNLFKDEDHLRIMWKYIKEEKPSLLPALEKFLIKTVSEIYDTEIECSNLESTFHTYSSQQDEHLQQLHQTLDHKMTLEREKLMAEERLKNQKIKKVLQEELNLKNRILKEMKIKHDTIGKRISQLKSDVTERKKENQRLLKEKEELERRLHTTENMRKDVEEELAQLRQDALDTRKRRAKSIDSVSREISLEEEMLAFELDMARCRNKLLLDEKDTLNSPVHNQGECLELNNINGIAKENKNGGGTDKSDCARIICDEKSDSVLYTYLMEDKKSDLHIKDISRWNFNHLSSPEFSSSSDSLEPRAFPIFIESVKSGYRYKEQDKQTTWKVTCALVLDNNLQYQPQWKVKLKLYPTKHKTAMLPKVVNNRKELEEKDVADRPDDLQRLFKIIFVGDSGVGKTSFIRRFCNGNFSPSFTSTIGIDFHVKSLKANNRRTALQLWDTAGQERFQSISKQYFRKADAVIIMYDVTSEISFRNVRWWIQNIRDNAEEGVALLLLGNKIDAIFQNEKDAVPTFHGTRLSKEYGALFFETSAKTGAKVNEAMTALASLLQEKEDRDTDKGLMLKEVTQTKKCC